MSFKEYYSLSRSEAEAHHSKWGGRNEYPPGWRKLSEAEFAQSNFFSHAPDLVEYRQMLKDRSPNLREPMPDHAVSAHLQFLWDGTGYAIVNDFWGKKVSFYAFGCDHDYEGDPDYKPDGACMHGYRCKKCGHKWVVDSSD